MLSCDPPAVGKWAAKAGDCDDDNKAVFPKESDFEASGYTATSTGLSFDYDCSNQEESDLYAAGCRPGMRELGDSELYRLRVREHGAHWAGCQSAVRQ